MSNTYVDEIVTTSEFRVLWPHLFKPSAPTGVKNAEPKYSMSLLFENSQDVDSLRALADKAIKAKWGSKAPHNLMLPFSNAVDKNVDCEKEDAVLVKTSSSYQPVVFDINFDNMTNPNDFYSGCYARAQLKAAAYDSGANKGVIFYLLSTKKTKDGERLGSQINGRAVYGADDDADY